jgi:hypothetical protein
VLYSLCFVFYLLLSRICSLRKYCEHEKTDLEILTDLIFSTLEYGNVASGMLFSVYIYALLAAKKLDGLYAYSVFRLSLSLTN